LAAQALQNTFNWYVENFPSELPSRTMRSFMGTTLLHVTFCQSTASVALLAGGLAVSVCLIEAATRPIIRNMLWINNENDDANNLRLLFVQIITATYLDEVAKHLTGLKSTFTVVHLAFWFFANQEGIFSNNMAMAHIL